MEILNLGGASEENIPPRLASRKNKKLKIAFGIGSLAAITGLGSTLAASITLNGDNPVEFGQGVAITAACNGTDDITFTPNSEYQATEGLFTLSSFTLSGINMTEDTDGDGIGCAGKVLIVRAFTDQDAYDFYTVDGDGEGTDSPLYLSRYSNSTYDPTNSEFYNAGIAIKIAVNGDSFDAVYVDSDHDYDTSDFYFGDTTSASDGRVTVNFGGNTNSGLDAGAIDKFTVESVDEINSGLAPGSFDWYESTYLI